VAFLQLVSGHACEGEQGSGVVYVGAPRPVAEVSEHDFLCEPLEQRVAG